MAKIVHVHASGRFDASASQVITRLEYIARQGANLITLTEVDYQRAAIIKFAGKEWAIWHPRGSGKAESAILWKRSDFTLVRKDETLLTNMHLQVGRTAPLYATNVILKTSNEKHILVSATHLPAHLDVNATLEGSKTSNWPAKVHRSASAGWARALRKRNVDGKIIAADWNLDFKRPVVVAYAKARFPRLHIGWRWRDLPVGKRRFGTDRTRFIDTVLSNLKRIKSSQVLSTSPGFDHRPLITVYSI